MADILIRRMEIGDSEAVVDVLIDSWQTAYRGIVSDDCLDNLDRPSLIERRKRQYKDYIVAVLDGKVAGYCWYINNNSFSEDTPGIDCEIVAIYVRPELERQGVGRAMLLYAEDDLRKQGKKKMVIWCLKDNLRGRRFYEKMGGVPAGEHQTHIGNDDYDEVGFMFDI